MKKRYLALMLCGAMAATGISAVSVAAESGTTLTFLASQDWIYDAEMELAEQFEAETGIHVDFQIIPADQYFSVLMTKLNSGEGPDIFGGQSGKYDIVSQYNVEENATDLSGEEWVATYDEFAKEQTSVGDTLYGMTYFDTTTDFYMVYNKVLFEEAGITEVPTTFDEYMEDCQKLLDNDIIPF